MFSKKQIIGLAALSLMAACGDDSSSANGSDEQGSKSTPAIVDCTADNEGEIVNLADERKDVICQNGEWVDVLSSSSVAKSSASNAKSSTSNAKSSSSKAKSSASVKPASSAASSSGVEKSLSSATRFSSSEVASSSSLPSSSSVKSSSSAATDVYLCNDGVTYVANPELCEKNSSDQNSSSSVVTPTSSETKSTSSASNGLIDSRDGKEYKTVKIGNLEWMAENLAFESSKSICHPDADSCAMFGRQYMLEELSDVCPEGWHVPSICEFEDLFNATGGYCQASVLKSATGWKKYSNVKAGTDEFGFNVLPSGELEVRNGKVSKNGFGSFAYYWTSSAEGSSQYIIDFRYTSNYALMPYMEGADEYPNAIRCVKGTLATTCKSSIYGTDAYGDAAEVCKSIPSSSSAKSSSSVARSSSSLVPFSGYSYFTDSRDNQKYATVMIGEQVWMAENLRYAADSSFCYNRSDANCNNGYGRYYQWNHALGKYNAECDSTAICQMPEPWQGVCPDGWHIPSKAEFDELASVAKVGSNLRSSTGWMAPHVDDIPSATDLYGFNAYPSGSATDKKFILVEEAAHFISTTTDQNSWFYAFDLNHSEEDIVTSAVASKVGKYTPVRCIKGNGLDFNEGRYGMLTDSRDGETYKTVSIGGKIWMAENLRYNKGENSCHRGSTNADTCSMFGRQYPWRVAAGVTDEQCASYEWTTYSYLPDPTYSVDKSTDTSCVMGEKRQGICPSGWHLPTASEVKSLVSSAGSVSAMKAVNGIWPSCKNVVGPATNVSGFNLPMTENLWTSSVVRDTVLLVNKINGAHTDSVRTIGYKGIAKMFDACSEAVKDTTINIKNTTTLYRNYVRCVKD